MSKFVKTPEELKEIQEMMAAGRFTAQNLTVEFETDMDYIKETIAPCFQAPDKPIGYINVSKYQSDFCGEFDCGIVYFPIKYPAKDGKVYDGTTMIALYVGNDMPVSIGREMWGEGKKRATSQILMDGHEIYGYVERNGVRIIQIDAFMGPDQGEQPEIVSDNFEFKAVPHAQGWGTQNDPVIVDMHYVDNYRVYREGTAEVKLTGTLVDPLDDIPIKRIGPVTYSEGASIWTIPFIDVLEGQGDAILPYMYGQKYDDFRYLEKPIRWRKK